MSITVDSSLGSYPPVGGPQVRVLSPLQSDPKSAFLGFFCFWNFLCGNETHFYPFHLHLFKLLLVTLKGIFLSISIALMKE